MRNRLLVSIIGIVLVTVCIAGLLGELDSLANPVDAKDIIPLENGLTQGRGKGSGGGISGAALAVKGPVKLSDDPVFTVSGATGVSYLRLMVGETYTGDSWLPPQSSDASQSINSNGSIPISSIRNSTDYSSTTVSISPIMPLGQGPIAISLYTNNPQGSSGFTFHPESYTLTDTNDLKNGYSFTAMTPVVSPDELRDAKTVTVTPSLLQLPDTLPQRVKDLAVDITRGKTNDYDKLEAIITYLQQYTYDLDNSPIPPGRDGVDYFLFDDKRGVCCTFSSSFVVLARAVGIPARVVGGWAISPVDGDQIVKAKQAHQWAEVPFDGLGWVTFEATPGGTGPSSRTPSKIGVPEPTVTEITSVNPIVNKGKTFNVVGKVTSADGTTIDGLAVELFINTQKETSGGVLVGKGTITKGTFSIDALIPNSSALGDYQLLAHTIGNDSYKESWSDPQIKVVTDTALTLIVPQRAKISDTVDIQGKLTSQDSASITGQIIDILLNGVPTKQVTTDENGEFNWTQIFDHAGDYILEVRFSGTEYQLPSSQKESIKILIPTVLNLQAQKQAHTKDLVEIKGTLLQDKTLIPVPNQQVQLYIDGNLIGEKLTTDQDGTFTISHKFTDRGNYKIGANFAGDSIYWESNNQIELQVTTLLLQRFPIWIFPCIAVALALIIISSFVIVRRWKKNKVTNPQADIQPSLPPEVVLTKEKSLKTSLKIEFPQIHSKFPDVWGIGDALEINFILMDSNGNPMADKPLQIMAGNGQLTITTDKCGIVKIQHIFNEKGEYLFKVKFSGYAKGENIQDERMLRLVDYREEIVNLFKQLTSWLSRFGVIFPSQATPREIQRAALRDKKEIPGESLENTMSYFEEADFSTHAISRNTYEQMYLAQNKIIQYGTETNN